MLIPWVPEATRLLSPAGQRPAKRAWGSKWVKRAKGRARVTSGGEPQRSCYVRYRFCTWSLIGYLKTCFFQRPQLVKTGHVKWTGFSVRQNGVLWRRNVYSKGILLKAKIYIVLVSIFEKTATLNKQQERALWTFMSRKDDFTNWVWKISDFSTLWQFTWQPGTIL